MNRPETEKDRDTALRRRITEGWLCFLFSALPLGYHNGYFDITETKALIFAGLAALLLAVRLALRLAEGGERKPLAPAEAGLLLWAAVLSLSSLLQRPLGDAVVGGSNRYQAAGMAALYAGVFLVLTREPPGLKWPRRVLLGTFAAVSLLALLNMLGRDPLGLIAPLRAADRGRYLSTVGNVNFLAAYAALLMPVCLAELALAETRRTRLVLAALSLLGAASLFGGSDAGLLGVFAALAALPLLLRDDPAALRRLPAAALMPFLGGLVLRCAGCPLSAAGMSLTAPGTVLLAALTALVLSVLLRRASAAMLRRAVRCYGIALAAVSALLLLSVWVFTAHPELAPGPLAAEYLVLDADWGTDRGAIWAACLRLYRAFPLPQKLFGGGAGCIAAADRAHRIFRDAVVDSAHNEYLHTLLCAGAVGLSGWLCCLAGSLKRAAESGRIPLAAGVIGCMAQAAVGIAQPMTTPLFIVLLALAAGERKRGNEKI